MCTALAAALAACSGGDEPAEAPAIVAEIEPALAALSDGAVLYQVAGTPAGVELVLSDGDQAVGLTYVGGELSPATPLGPASGYTFTPDDVDFDAERILAGVIDELDDPTLTRFEIVGGGDRPLYSAQVLSDAGGVLQIDLAADGTVLGAAPLG